MHQVDRPLMYVRVDNTGFISAFHVRFSMWCELCTRGWPAVNVDDDERSFTLSPGQVDVVDVTHHVFRVFSSLLITHR